MQLWMCLTNLTNSPMPAVNHCFFFFFSPHQVAIWNMTDSVGIRTSKWNQTKWQSVERGGGHRTPVPPMEKFGRWGCYMGGFWLTRTELQYWAQLSERKDKHQTMPFYFLSYWTANTISSANWPQNKQTHIHNLGSVICCFRSNNAIMSLREPCKGDCYLVFHIHDSGPSRGQGIDFLFFFFFLHFDSRHQVPVFVKFLSPLGFVDTSSQFWGSRGRGDIFWIDPFDQRQSDGGGQFVTRSVDWTVRVIGLLRQVI